MDGEIVIKLREEKQVKRFFGLKLVTEVTYKEQGFLFNMYTWCFLSGYSGVELYQMNMFENKDFVPMLLFSAAESYRKEHLISDKFELEDVKKWIEGMTQKD